MKKINLTLLSRLFQRVTAADAVTLLCHTFGAQSTIVYVDGRKFRLNDLLDKFSMFDGTIASEIELRFFGGPPAAGKWFNGTLLTMLLDHAAYQIAKGDYKKISQALGWINGQPA